MNTTMTVEEIRRANLEILIKESADWSIDLDNPEQSTKKGSATAVALRCGTPASYLSQVRIGYKSGNGKRREIGPRLARKLETGCGKPNGWMDTRHDDADPAGNELIQLYLSMNDEGRALLIEHAKLIIQAKKK